ncbi:hypothetical protein AMS68_002903 [Peltaster fructicola]|uniref:Elongator complex protein 1 n=1 Tax=Peltaster fructicola TaxID=286661 RepID=A0A6H0XRS0_9PEZI|nr:hypothetical protein AMS68_002903 [Peltaster fructicola]
MQNLRDIEHRLFDFDGTSPLRATAWDLNDDSVICAFGPDKHDPLLSLKRYRQDVCSPAQGELIASWDALSPIPELSHDRVLDLHCFSDTSTFVLILEGGDIYVVRETPQPGEDAVEIVGSVDAGIAAVAWSPDEELVAVVTKAETVLLMTRSFESTADVTLTADDLKVSNHVSVGWGKAETQFKGRGAKALRDPTIPEHIDAGTKSEHDDGSVSISWRGDGQYVAINSLLHDTTPPRRVIRVLTREGVLDSVSEPVDGMESALSWKPSGQTIASTQRKADGINVILFERNGLRHGEFSLQSPSEDLGRPSLTSTIGLRWNVDSTVLAVIFADRIQLWTTGNYRWYLKQELRTAAQTITPAFAWHPEKPLWLAGGSSRSFHVANYAFQYTLGSTVAPRDDGIVVSVDGTKLDITPLAIANVPPPMAFDEVDVGSEVIDVAVSDDGTSIAVLYHDGVSVLACDYAHKPAVKAKLTQKYTIEGSSNSIARQITWSQDSQLSVLSIRANANTAELSYYHKHGETTPYGQDSLPVASLIANLAYTKDGHVTALGSTDTMGKLPPGCITVRTWQHDSHSIVFGMTSSGVLHIRSPTQQLKVQGCTSFLTTDSYLILTTSQHLLKFVHLHNGELEIPADEPEKDERCRSIERGAKIVTVMPSSYTLVLQMPRGNLETIYPRALVLAGIRRNVVNRDYKKAFLICRSQRVDMNILYDHSPEQFLQDVDIFIKQVKKPTYIDLFLSSLSEEDTSQTIYRETLKSPVKAPVQSTSSKINHVCNAFLNCLQKQMPATLQNVITAYVCMSPPDLEAALRLVAALRKTGTEEEVEHAVEHVCFLADVNQLYDTALGLYELEVTLLVAQQSQKDPREYLPYLQGLQTMESKRQHFTIDNDLKRYGSNDHLHAMDAFDELTSYMKRHELYSTAIELYRHDKQRLVGLVRAYADFLVSRNRYDDAATLYEYVQDYVAANEAYRSAGSWRESLATAAMIPLSSSEVEALAETMAEAQEEAKDFTSAAVIRLDYLADLKGAVRLYCKAYNFAEATRLAILKQSPELLKGVIDPGLVECSASMTELLAEMKGQISAQVPRLRELRQKKIDEPMAYLNAGEGEDNDIPDNLSVAPTDASTSGGTFMTRYTNRSTGTLASNATRKTSKNRRREERKRAKGKKGTVYEEEYLVNSITRLIERLNTTSGDVTNLVQGLMRRAMRERAVAVENAMTEVWELCRSNMDEVYEIKPKELPSGEEEEEEHGQRRPWGGQGVLWESMVASQSQITAPVLKLYARSGALTS